MTAFDRLLLAIIAALVVAFGIFVFIKEQQMSSLQTQLNTNMIAQQNLLNGLVRSSSSYATSDQLNAFAQQNSVDLATIQSNLASINATLVGINVVQASSGPTTVSGLPSTGTTPSPTSTPTSTTVSCPAGGSVSCPGPVDTNKYTENVQTLALNETFVGIPATQVPIGSVSFDASKTDPWSENISSRQYNIDSTIGSNPDSGQVVVYNQLSIDAAGKTYQIPINTATFKQAPTKNSFSFWNPRLFLSMGGSVNVSAVKGEATPAVGMQIASYGATKTNPVLSIAQVGAGYNLVSQRPAVVVDPISLNVGAMFPNQHIISNTYLGPSIGVDTKGSVDIGLAVGLSF